MALIKKFGDNAVITGTPTADTLIVYGDNAILEGGAGNDTYIFAQFSNSDADSAEFGTVIEAAGGGTDKVIFKGDFFADDGFSLGENVENLSLAAYADFGFGNDLNNFLDATQVLAVNGLYGSPRLDGGAGNDTLIGSWNDDHLYGGTGNDSLLGGRGNDLVDGQEGNDVLNGGYGNDDLFGGDGNDLLSGGDSLEVSYRFSYGYGGDDFLYGDDGNDTLNGGNDVISSDAYGHRLYAGNDLLDGGDGNDVLNGGNDLLTQASAGYADVLFGGRDELYGGYGNDTLNGGDDRLVGGNLAAHGGNENIHGGFNTYYGGYGNDVINVGDTVVQANAGNEGIYGTYGYAQGDFGNDSVVGANQLLEGGAGDDIIFGTGRNSFNQMTFRGGYGSDAIRGGSIIIRGGSGSDKIYGGQFSYYGDGDSSEESNDVFDGNDNIVGASQTLDGNDGDDFIYAGYELYYGGAGNDTIIGGTTTINPGNGNDRVFSNGVAYQQMYGGYGNDILTAGNLVINGSPGENQVYGDHGRGVGYAGLYGFFGNDTLTGANGSDYLHGGSGNDRLVGNNGNDWFYGGAGNDQLVGGAGNDTLRGGYGTDVDNDMLDGGVGNDVFYVSYYGGNDTIIDAGGEDTVHVYKGAFTAPAGIENILDNGYGGDQTLTGNAVDNVIYGASSDDRLDGQAGNDFLDGGSGDDTMIGGLGNDGFVVDSYGDVVVEAAGGGTDTVLVYGYGYGDLPDNVENMTLGYGAGGTTIFGNSLNNVLRANAYANLIYGGEGNDTIIAGGGADLLIGGKGNDLYFVDNSNDTVLEINGVGTGTDTVRSTNGNFRLGAYTEHLSLVSTTGEGMFGWGNAQANRIEGSVGSDFMNGYGGNDTLVGNAGNDLFVVDSLGDLITEQPGGGFDTMRVDTHLTTTGLPGFVLAANVEEGELLGTGNLNLTGNTSDNELRGNNGANTLDGGLGNDDLSGGGGNDKLIGGAGNDDLDGEEGSDTMEGGVGNDDYVVNRGDGAGTAIAANEDRVTEAAGAGTDSVTSRTYTYTLEANVENLFLDFVNTAYKGVGNLLNNFIRGNTSNNVLSGMDGNDILYGGLGTDHLYGGAGADRMDGEAGVDTSEGGLGDDIYFVDPGDVVIEVASGGTDLVRSSGNFSIASDSDIENLSLYGGTTGSGNSANNIIRSQNGFSNDFLYGDAGNDLIVSGAGFDVVYGGMGNDTLQSGSENDNVYGYGGNDILDGGSGEDFLDGGDGNDAMAGGEGNDFYEVDSATDVITEAANAGIVDQMRIKANTELTLTMAANVERAVVFFGGAYGDEGHNITGNALANFISGDYGGNTISGGDGNDTILGATQTGTVLQISTDADLLNGDGGDDDLRGAGGADTLNGGNGNDFLYGGDEIDLMTGGAGDDDYHVDTGDGGADGGTAGVEDRIVELLGGGTDTVIIFRPLAAYTLPDQVENLDVREVSTAINATGNALANRFEIGTVANGDVLNGAGGNDTLDAFVNLGDGSVTTAAFEVINLELAQSTDADWTINGGNVAGQVVRINGVIVADGSSLTVNGLNASHTVILGDADILQGALTLALQSSAGGADKLNIVLGGSNNVVTLTSAAVEELRFEVRSAFNGVNVAGVTGESVFFFSGSGDAVQVSSLDNNSLFRLQNLELQDLQLLLANNTGVSDVLNLELDNVVIGDSEGGGLDTDDGAPPNTLETLNINTRGDDPFDNGGSFVNGSGIDLDTDVVLSGLQDLTVFDFGGDDFDASSFSGDLSGSFLGGATILTAGAGNYSVNMGAGVDQILFGTTLTADDHVDGSADTDFLTASLAAVVPTTYVLDITNVENIDFALTTAAGVYTFDLGEIDSSGAAVDIDLTGSVGSVTFVNPDVINPTTYNISAAGLTTGTLNVTTGSGNDTLTGDIGSDTLNGGAGSDSLVGGTGADFFVFDSLTGIDTVTGFLPGTDTIQLSLSTFGGVGTVGAFDPSVFVAAAGPVPSAANDHILYDTTAVTGGALFYDPDGNGATAAIQIATFSGIPALTAADFTVIS
jgi:trimeric autotransporter adhesin